VAAAQPAVDRVSGVGAQEPVHREHRSNPRDQPADGVVRAPRGKDVPNDRKGNERDREGKIRERGRASARTGGIESPERDAPGHGQEGQGEDEPGQPQR